MHRFSYHQMILRRLTKIIWAKKILDMKIAKRAKKEIKMPAVGLLFCQLHDIPPKNAQIIAISPIKKSAALKTSKEITQGNAVMPMHAASAKYIRLV